MSHQNAHGFICKYCGFFIKSNQGEPIKRQECRHIVRYNDDEQGKRRRETVGAEGELTDIMNFTYNKLSGTLFWYFSATDDTRIFYLHFKVPWRDTQKQWIKLHFITDVCGEKFSQIIIIVFPFLSVTAEHERDRIKEAVKTNERQWGKIVEERK